MKFAKSNRHFYRAISILAMVSLILTALPISATATRFSDVTRELHRDYYDAISWVCDNGYMDGTSSTAFSPNAPITRAMFVTVLYRYAGMPTTSGSLPFTDVPTNADYYDAVRWGYVNGVVNGMSDTTFSPDSTVTREQAFTLLWRFAIEHENYTPYYYGSITNATDYSSLSTYARNATHWIVSNGILVLSPTNPTLYPQAAVYRKELAIWLCRYDANIEGVCADERFSFLNSPNDFLSGDETTSDGSSYFMSLAHKNNLYSLANEAQADDLDRYITGGWGGSCYGMSLSVALDQLGYIDFNGSFSSANSMENIPKLTQYTSNRHIRTTDYLNGRTMTLAESAINFYQCTQLLLPNNFFHQYGGECIAGDTSISGLNNFVNATRHSGLTLVKFIGSFDGIKPFVHAILVFGPPTQSGNYYMYFAYDPNESEFITMGVTTDYSGYAFSNMPGLMIGNLAYITNFTFVNTLSMDLDGNYNAIALAGSESSSGLKLSNDVNNSIVTNELVPESVWLDVDLRAANYLITNAEGETVTITNGIKIGGTMPILEVDFFSADAVTQRIRVPYSGSFTFTTNNTDAENSYRVCWGELYAGAVGTGMDLVKISLDGIELQGTDMEYTARYSAGTGTNKKIVVSGSNETAVTLGRSESNFQICTQTDAVVEMRELGETVAIRSEPISALSTYTVDCETTDESIFSVAHE